ncbi:molybdenum cofactor guanylyltransferase [Brevundimonas sp.]|uniref:molybdenum cofactor guanylyltransferase n=1 Tax=Brevundimonas sp. TaxID=1871086 RepID=UPI0027233EB2|nr:molybdenum cofactor guanylyltransferase [Brevundimonas sp.]MDO9589399.1 molybdenum cofactor guanylyltransferase [Brevundimonas sp.]MDZ4109135.1 molybdenum cofactor guanylyltransferase [Brevundimonas sp.]HWQ85985.1 molybdenum cofactor guanylyltransferase [Brevundimonas sp.]
MSLVIALLAGGAGRRIGGGKPHRLLGGTRLLDRALTTARAIAAPTILVVREPGQVDGFAGTVVLDAPGIAGPLAGLFSALAWAADSGADRVLTLPCDMPFLPADLYPRLESALTKEVGAVLAASGGRLHPVCALWRTTATPILAQRASEGRLSLHGLSEAVGRTVVDWPVDGGDPFININTAEDMAAAETTLRRQS